MLAFLKERLPKILGSETKEKEKTKETDDSRLLQESETGTTAPPLPPVFSTGSLPWDFWPILAKLPYDISSNNLELVRETSEYKNLLKQYHLARQARKRAVEIQHQEQHTNTSIQSLEVLLKDTKLT